MPDTNELAELRARLESLEAWAAHVVGWSNLGPREHAEISPPAPVATQGTAPPRPSTAETVAAIVAWLRGDSAYAEAVKNHRADQLATVAEDEDRPASTPVTDLLAAVIEKRWGGETAAEPRESTSKCLSPGCARLAVYVRGFASHCAEHQGERACVPCPGPAQAREPTCKTCNDSGVTSRPCPDCDEPAQAREAEPPPGRPPSHPNPALVRAWLQEQSPRGLGADIARALLRRMSRDADVEALVEAARRAIGHGEQCGFAGFGRGDRPTHGDAALAAMQDLVAALRTALSRFPRKDGEG